MTKQTVRGPNMMRSQNPNPPNDLQEKKGDRQNKEYTENVLFCQDTNWSQM